MYLLKAAKEQTTRKSLPIYLFVMYLLKAAKKQTTRKSLPIYLSTGIYAVPTTGSSGADN